MSERFTFFWNGPFSQWHRSPFSIEGETFSHAEQWMMASKATLFGDALTREKIMRSDDPREQKRLGKLVRGFDEAEWGRQSVEIVYRGNIAKFSQSEPLLRLILATAGTTLVEASPYDKIWGIGLRETDPRALSRATWLGENRLGEILTAVRDELAEKRGVVTP